MNYEIRIRQVLASLATLSEVSAASLQPRASQSAPDSSAPKGQCHSVDDPEAPRKDFCPLHDWYAWHFHRAETDEHRRRLLYLAERDYRAHVEHTPRRTPSEPVAKGVDPESSDGSRVVEWYEGIPAEEAAMLEECSVAWVRKVREQRGRKGEDGRPKPGFLQADADERRRMVTSRQAKGWGAKKIADDLGVAKATVQRYMTTERIAA